MSIVTEFDVDEIIQGISSDNKEERVTFINACPPCIMSDSAVTAASMDMLEMRPQALDFLSATYANVGPYDAAAKFGEATYRMAKSMYGTGEGDLNTQRMIAGRGAVSWMSGLKHLGRQKEVLKVIEEPLVWLTEIEDKDSLGMLLLKRTEAEFDLERYDDVGKHLAEIREELLPPLVKITLRSQKNQLEKRVGGGGELRDEFPDYSFDDISAVFTGKSVRKTRKVITAEEGAELSKVANTIINRFFGGEEGAANEFTVRQKIIDVSYLFTDPVRGRDPDEIAKIIPVLIFGRDWMHANNLTDSENDACWSLYLCYSRTNREDLAARELQRLRSNIERARAAITDPMERSRLSTRYQYLYQSLATMLYAIGDVDALFEVIEASKGRVLADLQTERNGVPSDEMVFSQSIRALPALIKQANASYLTYIVDDDVTFAVLLEQSGALSMHKIEVGLHALSELAIVGDPRQWGKRDPVTLGRSVGVDEALTPFVEFLSSRTNIQHLCYSPSGPLLSLPLHCALLDGTPLAMCFSVSRIHGAASLYELLADKPCRPDAFLSIEVPAVQDIGNTDKVTALGASGQWLEQNMGSGLRLQGEYGNAVALKEQDVHNRVIHFATHGVFPKKSDSEKNLNPLNYSGLILSVNGQLPDLNEILKDEMNILSPQKIINMQLELRKSHVTLEACVTGLAKQSAGGDALGLEFAFLQQGAQSILSTHWNANIHSMTQFMKSFYKRWLVDNETRSVALRETILELSNAYGVKDEGVYYWGAFSLTGDWR